MAGKDFDRLARILETLNDTIRENAGKAIRESSLLADRILVFGTPVDTGRARGGWQVNINVPLNVAALNQLDPAGAKTLSKHQSVISGFLLGQTIFISNFVPYIGALNDGTSAQAPAGFVQGAISDAVAFLRRFKFTQ